MSWWTGRVVFWEHYFLTPVLSWLPSHLLSSDRHGHRCDELLSLRGAYSVNNEFWMEISNKSKPPLPPSPRFTCHSKHFIMLGNDHTKKSAEIKAGKSGGGGGWVCRRNSALWLKLAHTLKRKEKKKTLWNLQRYWLYVWCCSQEDAAMALTTKTVVQPLFLPACWILHITGALI